MRTRLGGCIAAFALGCSGGNPAVAPIGTDTTSGCAGACAASAPRLTVANVETVLAQAIHEARERSADATIAIVDRVGNVLAVYRMGDAAQRGVVIGVVDVRGGLNGIRLPTAAAPVNLDDQAAIAKAVTGAYLSSEGNAFSTRTASQIVQEHFNPGENFQPGGPLFGVQFSQLPCSDFSARFSGVGTSPGPHRSPLGLSADPGGLPLYKSGTVVGGVGVIADGVYSLDDSVADLDLDTDELIALAATFGFGAPLDRRGDRITVEGKTFRFLDATIGDLATDPAAAPALATIGPDIGALIPVTGYWDGTLRAGTVFGQAASGIRADGGVDFAGQDAFVFVDANDIPRFAPRAATDAATLGAASLMRDEVQQVLSAALAVADRARAQIRRPLSTPARVTISVVDTTGQVLGMVRGPDAPVFGADVSLQKARTAALFSSAGAAGFLGALPDAKYFVISDAEIAVIDEIQIADYVSATQAFLSDPNALADGRIAFSDRAGGNLSRPFFPDGIDLNPPGPFSKPIAQWSPFSTGLQLDVSINAILQHVLFVAGAIPIDVSPGCAGVELANDLSSVMSTVSTAHVANGLQIFPGSVPIFRGQELVGGIGVSGDGVDQDDLIAFLGLHNAGIALGGAIGNAPVLRRADTVTPQGVRLRYVQCPQAPFLDDTSDNVCEGK